MLNVLITGAASGIGKAVMNYYLENNHKVYAVDITPIKIDNSTHLKSFTVDITNPNDIKEVKEEASETVRSNVQIVGGKNAEIIASYDISLLLDGAEVQPGGKVAVTLPMPAIASGFDSIQVVFINDDGSVTPCETRLNQDGTITFVTDHFSHYAIIGVNASSNAGLIVGIIAGAVVLAVGGFAIFWFVIKKKTFADLLGGSKN